MQVYKTEKPGTPVHVYNLWYSRSLELDRYTAELQREQKVFEDLIRQKAYIVLPELAQVSLQKSHSYLNTGKLPSMPSNRSQDYHCFVTHGK